MNPVSFKVTQEILAQLPSLPGVYEFYDSKDRLIYVGKAINLKKRIAQYKNITRKKKDRKKKKILKHSSRLNFQLCQSETEALLLENQLIREKRPKLNVAGAFSFLYPCLGLMDFEERLVFWFSTDPTALKETYPEVRLYGVFRSKELTKDVFLKVSELLGYLSHAESKKWKRSHLTRPSYCIAQVFRKLPPELAQSLEEFLAGQNSGWGGELAERLLEKPAARRDSTAIQEALHEGLAFYHQEIKPLQRVRERMKWEGFVPQDKRDSLFIEAKRACVSKDPVLSPTP